MILIIEDNADHAETIASLLDVYGFREVRQARRFDEGLAIIAEKRPDVVLLDLKLPCGKTHLDMLASLKAKGCNGVVVVTGLSNTEVAGECVMAGATKVLVKGKYTPEELWSAVSDAIHRSQVFDKFNQAERKAESIETRVDLLAASGVLNPNGKKD